MGSKASKSASSSRRSLSPAPPDAKVLRSPLPGSDDRNKQQPKESTKRVLFTDEHDAEQETTSLTPTTASGLSLAEICTAKSTRHAEQLKQQEASDAAAEGGDGMSRFAKYRNFFKNHDTELAREITRMVTRANKSELRAWVAENVGELEFLDSYGKLELVELAMVSAAIARHGEKKLAKMDAKGELAALPNTALHTHDLRMTSKQQACRAQSKAARKDEMQAAHYVGLEVMMTLNSRLSVESRVGDELREILNHPSNLRLVLATTNQSLHKKADTLLMIDYELLEQEESNQSKEDEPKKKKKKKKTRNKPTPQEYTRLVQVAKHAQSDAFQEAMRAANGVELYRSLRDQFLRLDVGDRAVIWDVTKDTIVSRKGAATKAVVQSDATDKSGGKRRSTPSRSPSPAVDVPKAAKQSAAAPARGIATKANATTSTTAPHKPSKKSAGKSDEASTPPKETHSPIVKLVKKIKNAKPAKEAEKHARPTRAPKAAKQSKENLPEPNAAAASAKPSTRRVTRSRGVTKHVALPETFSDSSEYEDDSDE